MTTLYTCPECGSPMELVLDGLVGEPRFRGVGHFAQSHVVVEWVMVPKPFGACTGCEFCIELTPIPVVGYDTVRES